MAVYIDKELCKSCSMCVSLCPKNVFEITHAVNKKGYNYAAAPRQEECIKCKKCEKMCPDFAIYVE
ncbi:MAG: 4Fe-4S binding protein [Clostridiales bacterium]|nr:4Fe-4S binding protein [Clostridiales bacterium]